MDPIQVVLDEIRARLDAVAPRAAIVGVAGPVGVGKTTVATGIATDLVSGGVTARVVSTDAFLFANDALASRGQLMQKGFPDTYDADAIVTALTLLKRREPVTLNVYSHTTYDIASGATEAVPPADVIILEGVVALQPFVRRHLDLGVYIDAPEDLVRGWFIDRFIGFVEAARNDADSFYSRFARAKLEDVPAIAEATWDGINAVNLQDHIAPTKASADVVVTKGEGHAITGCHAV